MVAGGIGVSRRPNPNPAIKIFRRGDLLLAQRISSRQRQDQRIFEHKSMNDVRVATVGRCINKSDIHLTVSDRLDLST